MIDKNTINRILLISLSNLGDIILTTPVLERLSSEYPNAEIDVVTSSAGVDIFGPHPRVVKVIEYRKARSLSDRLKFVNDLRAMR